MKALRILIVMLAASSAVGCTALDRTLHELKPHRLWRLNRHDAPGREDAAFYSVRDPDAEQPASRTAAESCN